MKELLIQFFVSLGFMTIDITSYNATDAPVAEGEKELGELDDLEKTCFAFIDQKNEEHSKLHDQIEETEDPAKLAQLEHEHYMIKQVTELARNILWTSIANRFGNIENSSGYGIRAGNKVVSMVKKESENENGLGGLMKFLGKKAGGIGITVIEMKG